jgi:hypothetical protein
MTRCLYGTQLGALPNCNPDRSKGLTTVSEATPLAWEYWATANIFLPNGETPLSPPPDQAVDDFKAGWRPDAPVNQRLQAFSGPLIDRNGKWVHYASYMKRVEFDYLTVGKEL